MTPRYILNSEQIRGERRWYWITDTHHKAYKAAVAHSALHPPLIYDATVWDGHSSTRARKKLEKLNAEEKSK